MPVFVVVPSLLWLDRFEAEPTGAAALRLRLGRGRRHAVAVLVNSTSIALLKASGGDVTAGAVVIAPIVEETCKGLAVLLVFLYRRREFDGVVDGIVYAGMAGIGFAFTENVLYLGRALADSGVDGLAATFVLRCIFGPFAHPLFTMATGVGFGVAVTTRRAWLRYAAPVIGWLVAVTLHGLWNLSAVAGLNGFVSAYIALQVPIFLAALAFALWSRRREGRLIGRHLAVYAETGWLTPAEVQMLSSMPARRRARAAARELRRPQGGAGDAGLPGCRERAGPAARADDPGGGRPDCPAGRAGPPGPALGRSPSPGPLSRAAWQKRGSGLSGNSQKWCLTFRLSTPGLPAKVCSGDDAPAVSGRSPPDRPGPLASLVQPDRNSERSVPNRSPFVAKLTGGRPGKDLH